MAKKKATTKATAAEADIITQALAIADDGRVSGKDNQAKHLPILVPALCRALSELKTAMPPAGMYDYHWVQGDQYPVAIAQRLIDTLAWCIEEMEDHAEADALYRVSPTLGDILTPGRRDDILKAAWKELRKMPAVVAKHLPATANQRRRRRATKPRPLTAKQTEAMQLFGECKGNIAEAARQMGVDRKTFEQHYDAATKKLALTKMPAIVPKHTTTELPKDRRGQVTVEGTM